MRIGIIGGSIAGCTAAIVLGRAGHSVTVFERSTSELQGRGAGIATPPAVFDALVEQDLLDSNMPRFRIEKAPHVAGIPDDAPEGRTAGTLGIQLECMNWGDLQRNLRKRVPDASYLKGKPVKEIHPFDGTECKVRLVNGDEYSFDLVVCADGYMSLGRETLFPGLLPEYRGYVLWRGVLNEADLPDSLPLQDALQRVGYQDGHGVFYFVPGAKGSVEPGKRWVNWAVYLRVPESKLRSFLTDRSGQSHSSSLAPGQVPLEKESFLKAFMKDSFPGYYADIIERSNDTFMQAIYILRVPGYLRDRICLVGDAGSIAPPFTASGVIKSISNVNALADAVAAHELLDDALMSWDRDQTIAGNRMAELGTHLERLLIWDIPDFRIIDKTDFAKWSHQLSAAPYSAR